MPAKPALSLHRYEPPYATKKAVDNALKKPSKKAVEEAREMEKEEKWKQDQWTGTLKYLS
jgi:hypothetical protein